MGLDPPPGGSREWSCGSSKFMCLPRSAARRAQRDELFAPLPNTTAESRRADSGFHYPQKELRIALGKHLRDIEVSPTIRILPMRSARFQFWFGYWPAVNAASGPSLFY